MADKKVDNAYVAWFSTHAILNASSILARFGIHLPHAELRSTLANQHHVYSRLLHVPLMNIFNGIVFQQAYDYQVYALKLMIDYRLSLSYTTNPEAPSANIRMDLEEQYNELVDVGKAFTEYQLTHNRLISESQAWLIEQTGKGLKTTADLTQLSEDPDFLDKLNYYKGLAEELSITFRGYKTDFYNIIIRLTERLELLSDYRLDEQQMEKEREALLFDTTLGGL